MEFLQSSQFTARAESLMQEWHVPGLAIAVVDNDTISSRGYGYAILESQNAMLVTGDTVFDIASSSKSLTAAAVALLVADDEKYPDVSWDTPVSKILPEDFVMSKDEYTKSVTVEDILSHRTGLPSHDFSYLSPRAEHPDTPRSVTRNLRNLEITDPIRSKHMYCNMMFTVAAHLVEQLSGLSFEDFLRKHFWQPLEMTSTILQPTKAVDAGLPIAQPYKWQEEANTYSPVERQYSPEAVGAGLVVTSVNDYIRWVRAMMNQEAPINPEIYRGLIKPRSFANADGLDDLEVLTSPGLYGTGLGSEWYRGYHVVSHHGGDPGVVSIHFFMPEIKFGGVLLGNAEGAYNVISVLVHELIDDALGVPREKRPDWNAREHEIEKKEEKETEEKKRERRRMLCPNAHNDPQQQKTPLHAYTGLYWHAGYHGVTAEIKDDKLFIDATDRCMGFTLEFEHICDQTKYIAHMRDYYEGRHDEMAAEFVFEGGNAVKMGLELENDLGEDQRIWFKRIKSKSIPARTM